MKQPWQYADDFMRDQTAEYDRCDKDQLRDALEEYFAHLMLEGVIALDFVLPASVEPEAEEKAKN